MSTRFSIMVTGALPMKDYVPLAQQVEAYGFDQMHIADDLVFRPAWPILTMIAMKTSRLQLGPFIVTPQVANPVYHAAGGWCAAWGGGDSTRCSASPIRSSR